MRTSGAISVAGRINQGTAKHFGGNPDIERCIFGGDNVRPLPGRAAVCRAGKGNGVGGKIIPRNIDRAVRAYKGEAPIQRPGPLRSSMRTELR